MLIVFASLIDACMKSDLAATSSDVLHDGRQMGRMQCRVNTLPSRNVLLRMKPIVQVRVFTRALCLSLGCAKFGDFGFLEAFQGPGASASGPRLHHF